MIRSHFGWQRNAFDSESITLLAQQQEIFDILRVHAQQGGLCLVLGEPGTGKSVLKQALLNHDPKRMITPVVNRTLHTYHNTLRILCEAFQIEFEGRDHRCERLLVQEAFRVHRASKLLVPIIDDAHLMPSDCLRKLRLLCEDFPHSHNLVLIDQPPLLKSLALSINEEIRSRVTYSVSNHFHLVVETPKPNLVEGMKWFLGTYTSRFNRRHRLFGHLFSGRYKALVVDGSGSGYLKSVCDYVHLNPVRARLLSSKEKLSDYR